MSLPLTAKLLAVDEALTAAGIPHAFGGAIALAYYTREPRGTRDVDVNIFVAQADCATALAALPPEVDVPDGMVERIAEQGQARLWWGDMPLDVFFNTIPFHDQTAANVRRERFADAEIPVLGPVELAVFKAFFDRTKDWADIEAIVAAGTLDPADVREALVEMLGDDDVRLARLDEAVRRGRLAADED